MYLHLLEIAMYIWLGYIKGITEFQFAFCNKITRNYIFEVTNCRRKVLILSLLEERQQAQSLSEPLFGLVTQRALSQMGNRGSCVTRPNNGCSGDCSKRGIDASHFNLEVSRQ